MKRCTACGETKPVTEFPLDWRRSKPRSWCKPCNSAYGRAWNAANLDRHRANVRAWRASNRQRARELSRAEYARHRSEKCANQRAYADLNPERLRRKLAAERKTPKGRARKALRDAVYRGSIVKPSRCQDCGEPTSRARLHGHHHRGYDRPLDVVWLCSICHGRAHWKPIAAAA